MTNEMSSDEHPERLDGEMHLLGIDIHTRQPAAKTRVRMVPTYHYLWPIKREKNRMCDIGGPNLTSLSV